MQRLTIALIVCFLLLCTGCEKEPVKLPVTHSTDAVVRVEMVDNRNGEHNVIREITGVELESFILDLKQLECLSHWTDPRGQLGELYVTVHYSTGDKEMFGTSGFLYKNVDGEYEWPYENDYYVIEGSMLDLFEKHCTGQG